MIERVERALRSFRRRISRSEWALRLLRLPRSAQGGDAPGLIMIQIDGLSRTRLESALRRGRMPFVARLLEREGHRLHTFYSGVPATTPAVQAELFYGVRTAVPSFSFRHARTGKVVRMFESAAAAAIEASLKERTPGLLSGGSAYCDIYDGGAAESTFCAATLGLGRLLERSNPFALIGLAILHAASLGRTLLLALLELLLALHDFLRGALKGHSLREELKFVPKRVIVSIVLRELLAIGASMDAARGMPIIHVNFLGYDEQAHRRGPASAFAEWSLKGIDDAIRRISGAARRSSHRDYEVWIYADHGQERSIPFHRENGRTIEEAVAEALGTQPGEPARGLGIQLERARWIAGGRSPALPGPVAEGSIPPGNVVVTALGPLGHVYLGRQPLPEEREVLARRLVQIARVPLVLAAGEDNQAIAWTGKGRFVLPGEAAEVLGERHPFAAEAAIELVSVCRHVDAGDFVIAGWRLDALPVTFAYENGAHAGPGAEETRAFAILPAEAPVWAPEGREYLRALDLRDGALRHLGRSPAPRPARRAPRSPVAALRKLRIMTYNVHSCIGMDGKVSPARIARVIARFQPDIVALQELDVGRSRTRGIDQALAIAEDLEMELHFHPALQVAEEKYGDAVLSRLPMRLVRAEGLPALLDGQPLEPRGALWVSIDAGGREVQLLNTHLSLSKVERLLQAETLLGPEWLSHPLCAQPVILCGDLNAFPSSAVYRRFAGLLKDTQIGPDRRPRNTWTGRYPVTRIDYIFTGGDLDVLGSEVPRNELTRVASDHLPLVVEVEIPPAPPAIRREAVS